MGDKVEVLTDPGQPVFSVMVPRIVAAEAAEEEAGQELAAQEGAEPEVIGEKPAEGEAKKG